MRREESGITTTIATLFHAALGRVAEAIGCLFRSALRPATQRTQRWAALLLLGSVAALICGVAFAPHLSSGLTISVGLLGAVGLLVAGYTGTKIDTTAPPPSLSGEYPRLQR